MEARRKCSLRTAAILAAILIPGGCLALLAFALLRGKLKWQAPAGTPSAPPATAAEAAP